MAETPIRSIRVPDDIWAKAQEVAYIQDTTVSAMILEYLKKVNYRQGARTRAIKVAREQIGVIPRTLPPAIERNIADPSKLSARSRVKIDPANCEHKFTKEIRYGTFCTACGRRMDTEAV